MEFTLNGQATRFDGDPAMELLSYLRDVAGLKSPKDGCSGEGICGCCTILVDGKARLSCRMALKDVAGRDVTTLEGLTRGRAGRLRRRLRAQGRGPVRVLHPGHRHEGRRHPAARTPTPRARRSPTASPATCAGAPATRRWSTPSSAPPRPCARAGRWPFPKDTGAIGTRHPKYSAREAVLGERVFVADMVEPGMVFGALRCSDHPRARVLKVDIGEALRVPGVLAVLTARDIKGKRINGMIYRDWPVMVMEGEETRCIGDVLASVAAETEAAALAGGGPGAGGVRGAAAGDRHLRGAGARRAPAHRPRQRPVGHRGARGRRRGGAQDRRLRHPQALHHPAHRARLPGDGGGPGRALEQGRRARGEDLRRRPGRLRGPAPDRRAAGPARARW